MEELCHLLSPTSICLAMAISPCWFQREFITTEDMCIFSRGEEANGTSSHAEARCRSRRRRPRRCHLPGGRRTWEAGMAWQSVLGGVVLGGVGRRGWFCWGLIGGLLGFGCWGWGFGSLGVDFRLLGVSVPRPIKWFGADVSHHFGCGPKELGCESHRQRCQRPGEEGGMFSWSPRSEEEDTLCPCLAPASILPNGWSGLTP